VGLFRVAAPLSRPYRDAVRAPHIRTGGGFVKRLGRIVVWLLIVVLVLRGLASVMDRRAAPAPARAPKAVASPAWPDDPARAFAADFARAYLSYSPTDPGASAKALQPFVTPQLASAVVPQYGMHAARETVGSITVARTVRLDGTHALVTVAATVNGQSRYLTVPVARDGHGGLVVSDLPSFAAPPPRAAVPDQLTQAVPASEQGALQDVVSRFLRAYLGDDSGSLTYLVPPGTQVGAVAEKLQLVQVDSLALAAPPVGRERVVVASVSARDPASGATFELQYRLRLVLVDRWLVASVNDGTR
jgi:Conjugative transposon protein TcpC